MRFGVLGPLAVWTSRGEPVPVPELKVRALLADLLANEGRPVSADRLAEDLWGARMPGNPARALQRKVWQLRRTLDEAEPGGRELVRSSPPGYLLAVGKDDLDAHRFTALTDKAQSTEDPAARAALLSDALKLWRGPAFADFRDEEFLSAVVIRLNEQWLAAVEADAEARLRLGQHTRLVGELAGLVEQYPLRERLRAAYMRALYRAGRQTEAMDSYRELRERLAGELGLDPGPELVALHQSILEQDPALAAAPEPRPGAARPRTNLPGSRTELVGRAGEVREVHAALRAHRLVTLTGPGGVGKTRLAVETASEVADAFPDGVWLVALAGHGTARPEPVRSSVEEIAEAVTAVLGVRDDSTAGPRPSGIRSAPNPAPLLDRLDDALRGKRLLLVLDGCERVIATVAELADRLLGIAPELRIMATSQESLRLAGEFVIAVGPLELPDPAAGPEEIARSSAVRLFVARASASAPGFALGADNARDVATLCRRLDGIPLALELAATRVRAIGVRGMVDRLDDRFRLLSAGHRGAPPRQKTLRAMIDWSWQLLTEPERVVLRRLAVHADGCTLDAAEAVCAGSGVATEDVLDLLAHLVERSLVVTVDEPGAPDGPAGAGAPRYRLLESVAAYGVERLREADELEPVRARHRRYYTELAELVEPELRGRGQLSWLNRLDAEGANFRAALDSAARAGDAEWALRLVNGLTWYWYLRGRHTEARRSLATALAIAEPAPAAGLVARARTLRAVVAALSDDDADLAALTETALSATGAAEDPHERAMTEWLLAFAQFGGGDPAIGARLADRALAGFEAAGDRWGVAAALSSRALQAVDRDDLAAVARDGERSLALFREIGDRWGISQAVAALGALALARGDYAYAAELHGEGLRAAEELGMRGEACYNLAALGRVAMLRAEYTRAEELGERALRMAVDLGDTPLRQYAELGLALTARRTGDLTTAETRLRDCLERSRRLGWLPGEVLALSELGFIAQARSQPDTAHALHAEALAAAKATGGPREVALALEGLSGAEAMAGRPEQAARLLGAAASTRRSASAPLPVAERADVDRIESSVRTAISEEAFEAEFDRGVRNGVAG